MRKPPLTRSQRQLRDQNVMMGINAVKMVSLLILRNQGYGEVRLTRFSDKFNETIDDIRNDYLSLTDIADALQQETGIDPEDFRVELKGS